jgi:2-methylcitrate dehydratase PrpD
MAINTKVTADHNAPPITQILAKFVATHPSKGWSDAVDHEAHRTFVNWLGCAVGAANHEAVLAALKACQMLQPAPQAAIAGRRERVDMGSAALINGISSHTFDFDDTHLKTIIHPAGPVASALFALAEVTKANGRQIIDALVLGIDVSCRIGNMMYPEHYDRGWHITGSTGTMGAAAGCARLLGLNEAQTMMALGIAASQPVGLREQFGTMTKPLHPGASARAGLMSALMAQEGFTASKRAIEAPRGFAQVVSTKYDWTEITHELGERFEISFNTYKPFACGIVIHPSIDACISLRDEYSLKPSDIESIELKAHSLVLELTGKKTPQDGLQGKFSVYHASAAGIIYGRAGEEEFSDEIVQNTDVIALRDRITAVVDDSINEAAVSVSMKLKDGRVVKKHLEHAIGSMQRPMSDAALNGKFMHLSEPVLGSAQSKNLCDAAWAIVGEGGVAGILAQIAPRSAA